MLSDNDFAFDGGKLNMSQNGKMHVGVQGIGTSKQELEFLVRHGVTHMDASVGNTEVETLLRHKEEAAEQA